MSEKATVVPAVSDDRSAFGQDGVFADLKSAVEKGPEQSRTCLCSLIKARLCVKRFEMIRKIEMEGFSLTTSKRFDEVIAGVNAAIGRRSSTGNAWTRLPVH
jgi:hypothetical protein